MKNPEKGYRRITAYRLMLLTEGAICALAAATTIMSPAGIAAAAGVFAAAAGAVGLSFTAYVGGDAYQKGKYATPGGAEPAKEPAAPPEADN